MMITAFHACHSYCIAVAALCSAVVYVAVEKHHGAYTPQLHGLQEIVTFISSLHSLCCALNAGDLPANVPHCPHKPCVLLYFFHDFLHPRLNASFLVI